MKEVNFRDRVPTYPGRVRLVPVSGDLYDLVRADEPREIGTPLDRATFNSIIHSRLTGRYYEPTVSRQTVSSVSGTVSPIPQSGWINDTETGAENGAYKVTASGSFSSSYGPSEAFDGSYAKNGGWRSRSNDEAPWIAIDLGAPIVLTKIKTHFMATYTATQCFLYGSNNGVNWSYLAGVDEIQEEAAEWSFENTYPYQHYKLEFNNVDVMLYEWEFTGYTVTTYRNEFTISDGWPSAWTVGQVALVQIQAGVSTLAVVSNTINGVTVGTILQPNRRYELRYTGSAFAAKEV